MDSYDIDGDVCSLYQFYVARFMYLYNELLILFFSVRELTANVCKFKRMMKDSCHIKSGIHISLA